MKKIVFFFAFIAVCFSLSGCGDVNFAPGQAYLVPTKRVEQRS